ncbi:MAG: 2,3,4,5-tetrahydropyridine-2,6-dicarboxylate N-succinyltransferase [Cyanobacteria bacterium NC_groundwater_1444_Ag_S-0.65um_54_12]|nr:2,3,4,5-tetrahydropyridine-2,6-dicarboxylate N-succinyltransferase [Cyanobacteria bacterium NC_groundwater_1444_Ag_S-0.65um_54_12]
MVFALDMKVERCIRGAFRNRDRLTDPAVQQTIHEVIAKLDRGELRAAEKIDGTWKVNSWIPEAIALYFVIQPIEALQAGILSYRDKIPLKTEIADIRVVPPGVARYGSHLEPGVILMPGYVNIGAYVGAGTLIDTWATVGSCAQVGRDVHLSGGVGLGGVLEPPSAYPVIVEDGVFVGSRCVIVEGVLVEEEAVLGAGVILTASTPIVDVTRSEPVIFKGWVPARSVVIPGSMPKQFPAGEYNTPCALIIGQRSASTDRKTSLNQALRTFEVPV